MPPAEKGEAFETVERAHYYGSAASSTPADSPGSTDPHHPASEPTNPHSDEKSRTKFVGMATLGPAERSELESTLPAWTVDGEVMRRTFEFANFVGAMGFVTQVAILAEKANHHPAIDIRWNKVALALTTHDEGGLTERDAKLAEKIDSIS
jgi:4a-hydroxytetrahydrobiopterin dehydratase